MGLELSVGPYVAKGCYAYNNGQYPGGIYYGTGGSEDQIRGPTGYDYLFRPPGYDCESGISQ